MSVKEYPSIAYIRQCVREENGQLFWLSRPRSHFNSDGDWKSWNVRFSGKEAGNPRKDNEDVRWRVRINNKQFYRYTIIWALLKNEWILRIDHKNRNSLNDKIENLRPATQSQNIANSKICRRNTSGFKGVFWDKSRGKWLAAIRVKYKIINIGRFNSREEARSAYLAAAKKHFGEFASEG